jgi:hypothetical protein
MSEFEDIINRASNEPKFGSFPFVDPIREVGEKQVEKQVKILEFLKSVTIEQSETADKQFKNTKKLTYLALIFAFISIFPTLKELILPNQTKILSQNIYELEKKL